MVKPTIKSTIPHHRNNSGVHFRMAGEILTLDDHDGSVGLLVELLDGTRTADEAYGDLSAARPHVTRAEFDAALVDLDDSRLLHDGDAFREGLTDEMCERWSRNLGFFETYASMAQSKYSFQRRIRDTKVALLGVGGVGSHVLMDLVAIGFTDIRIVDFDTVDLSNLNRQVLYGDKYLGQVKVDLAKQWVERFNGEVELDTINKKLMSADDVYAAVHDRDIVVAAVDRPKTRALPWLNEGCVRAGAALITGGVDTQRALHHTVVPGVSGCLECFQSAVHATDEIAREMYRMLREQEDAGLKFGEDTAAFNGLVALQTAFIIGEVSRLATGITPPLSVGRLMQVTFQTPTLTEMQSWERDPDCPVCRDAVPSVRLAWVADATNPPPSLVPAGVWEVD
jgi:molybdopterin/thiamine biosynthesis adenylyltransferase